MEGQLILNAPTNKYSAKCTLLISSHLVRTFYPFYIRNVSFRITLKMMANRMGDLSCDQCYVLCFDFPIHSVVIISRKMALRAAAKGKLIAVIGDEDTCTGFLLGGIGELDKHRKPNFLVVGKDTSISEIEEAFRNFCHRSDIAIILINQNTAEMIRHEIDAYSQTIPAILEIPSKEHPYDPAKDSILRRAKGMFSAEDFR